MRDEELRELHENVRRLIQPHLRASEPLRRVVEGLGRLLVEEARRAESDDSQPTAAESTTAEDPAEDRSVADEEPTGLSHQDSPASEQTVRSTVPLRLGDRTIEVAVTDTHEEVSTVRAALESDQEDDDAFDGGAAASRDGAIDLEQIERRCRLKADSCRVFIDRRAAMYEYDFEREQGLISRMDEMIARAKAMPRCFLWAFYRERTQPDDATLRRIGQCYDALADAVSVLREVESLGEQADENHLAEAMELAAESHSALRVVLMRTWLDAPDVDQNEVHHWLRRESTLRSIYLPRYMKLDDPADPDRSEAVSEESRRLLRSVRQQARQIKEIDEEFKKIRYHVRQVDRNSEDQARHDYRKIAEAVDALVEWGVPPTDRRFRQAISPHVIESVPGDISMGERAAQVFGHVLDWHRADAEADETDTVVTGERTWSDQVHEVRALLAGNSVVVIGGEPRPDAEERIRAAFELSGVNWVRLVEHGSSAPMRAPIARAETGLVLVLIKLAGHQHAEDASAWARDYGKPCVFLKAGYNPEQVADAVLQQASEQLREMRIASQ